MTPEEEKQLLLKDLCGRLPYGVIFQFGGKEYHLLENINYSKDDGFVLLNGLPFSDCKPYLRPLSSMTEDEIKEWDSICVMMRNMPIESIPMVLKFVNSKHLDYNNLIPKGLALEAPEGMYNF